MKLTEALHIEASRLAAEFGLIKNVGSTGAEFEAANSEILQFSRAAMNRGAQLALMNYVVSLGQDEAYCERQLRAIRERREEPCRT